MGNEFSTSADDNEAMSSSSSKNSNNNTNKKSSTSSYTEFFSSAGKTIGEASGIVCGSLNDTFEEGDHAIIASHNKNKESSRRQRNANNGRLNGRNGIDIAADDLLCGNMNNTFSPVSRSDKSANIFAQPDDDASLQTNPMSALFARALLNEVSDPATMRPNDMAAREKKLLKAQTRAKTASKNNLRAIGGQGTIKGQLNTFSQTATSRIMPPNLLSENRAQVRGTDDEVPNGKHRVTIGLMLSRRDSKLGHADTVTRQTAFDFNELQDRQYKYVSSTDSRGWRAGGGESGKLMMNSDNSNQQLHESVNVSTSTSDDTDLDLDSSEIHQKEHAQQQPPKVASQDTVHIPIIHIDCDSSAAIDSVIAALARGEVFIPHMSVLPEALGVNGISPPDLVVRFGCERNDDLPPEEWPNWCLEFMHNQLYDYFSDIGAKWMKRPFQITLAKKVRWKTVKHMQRFFTHSENVINTWREKGPQQLDPQPSYIEGGASPEEVSRPHGIYLLRNGKPTNYFAPNFEPPYTTKMTRSLLLNVMGKSWDRKRRDWSSEPLARVTTNLLLSTMCGCAEPNDGGYLAREATMAISPYSVKSRSHSFFGGDKAHASSSNKAEYSPFKKKTKNIIEPQLTQKTHDQPQNLYEGLKVKREGSGIRRSQLQSKDLKSDTMETEESYSPPCQDYDSKDEVKLVDSDESPESMKHHDSEDPSFDENEAVQKEQHLGTDYDWMHTPEKRCNPSNLDHETFDMEQETPNNYFSPSQKETPIITNQERRKKERNKANFNNMTVEAIPEERDMNNKSSKNHDAASQSQAGISVAESQTTVPTFNGSSAKFIEQERERRKERELQRQKEREKIDKLERAIEEKMRINQEKQASTPERSKRSNDDKGLSEKKSSKKDKKVKKEKKKREKKERREREKSKDGKISQKIEKNIKSDVDNWNMESLSQQASKENFPSKYESQVEKDNKVHSSPKKASDWSNDSSYLPINLNGNNVNDSPVSSRYSQSNQSSSKHSSDLDSQVSLDYSMDTASLLGDGSLIGGQFAGDSSVFTATTSASDNKSLLSCVTRSTVHDMTGKNKSTGKHSRTNEDENDDVSLTLVASTSSGMELIPTDEELFAIGWAKAMDPNSGSYYYYTLDRSKTVWDNPLNK